MPVYVPPPHRRGNEKRKGPVQVLILIVCREELGVGLLSLSPSFFPVLCVHNSRGGLGVTPPFLLPFILGSAKLRGGVL